MTFAGWELALGNSSCPDPSSISATVLHMRDKWPHWRLSANLPLWRQTLTLVDSPSSGWSLYPFAKRERCTTSGATVIAFWFTLTGVAPSNTPWSTTLNTRSGMCSEHEGTQRNSQLYEDANEVKNTPFWSWPTYLGDAFLRSNCLFPN